MRISLLKPWAFISAGLAVVMLTLAVVLATLAIPIYQIGHDVIPAMWRALLDGHLLQVAAERAVAILLLIVIMTTLMKRTSASSGDAGGHFYRRITAGEPQGLAHSAVVVRKFFSAMVAVLVWARAMFSFGRPNGHSFAV